MAQFDVYRNPNPKTSGEIPYLLDVQSDLLDNLATRVVAPLFLASVFDIPATYLNPQFIINQTKVILSTAELAGISTNNLGEKIASLQDQRQEIIAALDFLFTGI